jgi:hypothetical protein
VNVVGIRHFRGEEMNGASADLDRFERSRWANPAFHEHSAGAGLGLTLPNIRLYLIGI